MTACPSVRVRGCRTRAALAELVDAPDLGSGSSRSESSSLLCRTIMKRIYLFLLPLVALLLASCEDKAVSTPTIQASPNLVRTSAAGVQDTISYMDTLCVNDTVRMGLVVSGVLNPLTSFTVKADTSNVQVSLAWNSDYDKYLADGSDPEHAILNFVPEQVYIITTTLKYIPLTAGTHTLKFIVASDAGTGYSPREAALDIVVKEP